MTAQIVDGSVVTAPSQTKRGSKLYRDAAALASSSMLTAVLGMGFWAICGRLIEPSKLGVQTALLSIIVAPGIVVASGVGDAFTALVPAAGPRRAQVIRRGYMLALSMSVVLGLIAAIAAVTVLPQTRGNILVALLVFASVVVWSLFVVQDPALTSMRRAHWLPFENGSVSILKIVLLPLALVLGVRQPVVIASMLPSIAAIAVLYPRVRGLSRTIADDPHTTVIADADREVPKLVTRTTTSVALSLGTLTLTPFIVTATAGPSQGAVFSLCLSIVQAMDFVGAALGVSLVVHASAKASEAAAMALGVFKRTALIVGLAGIALVCVAPFVLRMLNPSYVHLRGPLVVAVLALGSFARVIYVIWAALQRARRNMRTLLILNAVAAAFVLITLPFAADSEGAVGAAVVIAAAQVILSAGASVQLLAARMRSRTI
jgi:O-antigen/teichoic acid export membrane protein